MIVIIERYNELNFFWNNLSNKFKDLKSIIQSYGGFEGNCIEMYNTNAISEQIKNNFYQYRNVGNDCFLFLIEKKDFVFCDNNFRFNGFDYGYIDHSSNIYSSIFNEILFGSRDSLKEFESKLNKNKLFSSVELAEEYSKQHYKLKKQGLDVEEDSRMRILKVFELV